MGKKLLTGIVVLMALSASASAATRHYFPKPHHRCRAHYVRRMVKVATHRHGRTVMVRRAECVHVAAKQATASTASNTTTTTGSTTNTGTTTTSGTPKPTGTVPTTTSIRIQDSMATWFAVSGSLYSGGQELVGKPLTYTVTDATTGQRVATFPGTSISTSSCSVVYSIQGSTKTYSGQPVPPFAGCDLQPFSMPAADPAVVTATFEGDSTYAPSTSPQASFS